MQSTVFSLGHISCRSVKRLIAKHLSARLLILQCRLFLVGVCGLCVQTSVPLRNASSLHKLCTLT